MALPPIFKFKNIRVKLIDTTPTLIYGVISNDGTVNTLDQGIKPADVSTVILTVQISNLLTSSVPVSAYVYNGSTKPAVLNTTTALALVKDYPLLAKNAFDPLSGNLVLASGNQLYIQSATANACDVVVSLLEIANATAS